MKSFYLKTAVTAVLMAATAVAFGAPPPGKGPGGGGPGEETGGNKLAVPAILVGGPLSFTCGTDAFGASTAPSGNPLTGYELPGYYYIQGLETFTWQAACKQVTLGEGYEAINVFGAWGDNLVGDAKLKVGSPIRVEIVLYEGDGTTKAAITPYMDGWDVLKLEPNMLDRESPYGIEAFADTNGGYYAVATLKAPVVYDIDAHLTIRQSGAASAFVDEPIAPEINATGKVVYGYNLRVPNAGTWVITFTMPNLNFVGCDLAGLACAGQQAAIEINVGTGGGGGGGKKGGK